MEATTFVKAITIHTKDRFPLAVTRFSPLISNGEVVLIGSATAVHQPYYHKFATFLASSGYCVYTFDYRGVGQSRPRSLKGFKATLQMWGKFDLDAVIKQIRDSHPHSPITYIGHSIGGQLTALTPESQHFSRIILVASQLTYWGLWPLHTRFVYAFLVFAILPLASRWWGYFPGKALGIFWDLPKDVALELARWGRLPKGLFSRFSEGYIQGLEVPLLAVSFSDDLFAPVSALRALVANYCASSVTWHRYAPWKTGARKIGHLGFFRKQFSASLWKETLHWIERTAVVESKRKAEDMISHYEADAIETCLATHPG